MKTLKNIALVASLTLSTLAFSQTTLPNFDLKARGHGGGNGGDDLELELKKISLQIGYFIKSSVGAQVFKQLNPDAVIEAIESTDIDVVSGNVTDKYGTLRTCVNEPEKSLITCNLQRIAELQSSDKEDILVAILFHEILGVMSLELGHQENVSMYPVSSKILPYASVVLSTPISEANIRPEYYGKDNRSYGVTLVNKKTKESIRMICLNDNVEIHRCRNYSVVRKAGDAQAPLVEETVSLSRDDLMAISKMTTYETLRNIFNLDNNLALIDTSESVSDKKYVSILDLVKDIVMSRSKFYIEKIEKENSERIAKRQDRIIQDFQLGRYSGCTLTYRDYSQNSGGEYYVFGNIGYNQRYYIKGSKTAIEKILKELKSDLIQYANEGICVYNGQ